MPFSVPENVLTPEAWEEAMGELQGKNENAPFEGSTVFWFVVQMDRADYSTQIETPQDVNFEDSTYLIAKKGRLIGVAANSDQLREMTKNEEGKYVYLLYKIRVRGNNDLHRLLKVAYHMGMLESPEK